MVKSEEKNIVQSSKFKVNSMGMAEGAEISPLSFPRRRESIEWQRGQEAKNESRV
jgi:hypothetical protein